MKLTDLKAGDEVFTDSGFTCVKADFHQVKEDAAGLYINCRDGKHYLSGQLNANGDLVGILPGPDPRSTIELMAERDAQENS